MPNIKIEFLSPLYTLICSDFMIVFGKTCHTESDITSECTQNSTIALTFLNPGGFFEMAGNMSHCPIIINLLSIIMA